MTSLRIAVFLLIIGATSLAACNAQVPTATLEPTKAPDEEPTPSLTATPSPTLEPTVTPNLAVPGGTIIVGTEQEPETLNPMLASQSIVDTVGALSIEGLVGVSADNTYEAVLADGLPTASRDGLVITYKLKKGIEFSNGDPFTCDDVKFTYDAIMSDLSRLDTSGYQDIDSVECPNDYTAVVTFAKVYAPYLDLFSFIVPKSVGKLGEMDSWEYNRAPIGTGPWVVKKWQEGDSITFAKNPNYRDAAEGKPYLDNVIIKIVPSKEAGMQMLGDGDLDVLLNLSEADFPALKQLGGKVTWMGLLTGAGENEQLVFNLGDPVVDAPQDPAENPHPILYDLKVRQAIQMGIDRQLIADVLLYGNVQVGTTVLPGGPFACPQKPSTFDPKSARKQLDGAGWRVGADGIRVCDGCAYGKKGDKLSLRVASIPGNKLRKDTELVLVEMMKAIGVEFKIETVPPDTLFASWGSRGVGKHGDFDILMYTSDPAIDPGEYLYSNYHSSQIPTKNNDGSGSNYSRYIDPDVDEWIDDAALTTDMEERHDLYCQVAAQINKDLPHLMLYEHLLINGYRTHLKNLRMSGDSRGFIDSQDWWIQK